MEKLAYYTRIKEEWTEDEDVQLKTEYNYSLKDVIQIADIHKRTPGEIASRLKKLELVNLNIDARGYQQYQSSDLYREIVMSGEAQRNKAKEEKNVIVTSEPLSHFTNNDKRWQTKEVDELLKEYNVDGLSLLEISKIHKRLPSKIMAKLIDLEIVKNKTSIKGYVDYKKTDLYTASKKTEEKQPLDQPKQLGQSKQSKESQTCLELEVAELKEEMNSMKETLKTIRQMLNSLMPPITQE